MYYMFYFSHNQCSATKSRDVTVLHAMCFSETTSITSSQDKIIKDPKPSDLRKMMVKNPGRNVSCYIYSGRSEKFDMLTICPR